MIFGADPDAPTKEWEDDTGQYVYMSRPIRELVNYFGYHPSMTMNQRWNDTDRLVVAKLIKRRLSQGYTFESLKKMIDRFYQSWAGDSTTPAFTFVSNDVQRQLTLEADVVKDDPVLEWLLHGMPTNVELFVDPQEMRKCVSLHGMNCLLRAPEDVADILRANDPYDGTAAELMLLWEKVKNLPPHETVHQAIASIPIRKQEIDW